MFVRVIDGQLELRGPGRVEVKLADGRPLSAPDGVWTVELAALCGFVEVVDTPQPPDTATDTHDRSVALVAGVPMVVWTARPMTDAELHPPRTVEDRLGAAVAALVPLDALEAPVGPVDLVQTLTAVRTALED